MHAHRRLKWSRINKHIYLRKKKDSKLREAQEDWEQLRKTFERKSKTHLGKPKIETWKKKKLPARTPEAAAARRRPFFLMMKLVPMNPLDRRAKMNPFRLSLEKPILNLFVFFFFSSPSSSSKSPTHNKLRPLNHSITNWQYTTPVIFLHHCSWFSFVGVAGWLAGYLRCVRKKYS